MEPFELLLSTDERITGQKYLPIQDSVDFQQSKPARSIKQMIPRDQANELMTHPINHQTNHLVFIVPTESQRYSMQRDG